MFHDAQIQEWIENHGAATSFNFIIYGDINHDEVELLIKGLIVQLEVKDAQSMAVFFDPIDEKQAVAWKMYRGTTLTFVFAGDKGNLEEMVSHIILDGLEYLRFKAEYIQSNRSVSYV